MCFKVRYFNQYCLKYYLVVIIVKAWEKLYSTEDLDEALKIADDVEIRSVCDEQIIARVGDFHLETIMEYGSPSYLSCSCSSSGPCRHEAALVYYILNHPEVYPKKQGFEELFNSVCEDDLKNFLLEEFKTYAELKERFIRHFSSNSINRDYYSDKLSDIFTRGEGRDFKYNGFHDLDLMESELYEFIFSDISDILESGEHDFACGMMIRIAKLLNDEVISTYDSWYDLADAFMEKVNILSFSVYLDSKKLDELNSNMDHIMACL